MTLTSPMSLLWLMAAIPIIALYAVRTPRTRHVVPTMALWDEVLGPMPSRRSRRGWRRTRSLLMQVAIVALLVLAMAGPRTASQSAEENAAVLASLAAVFASVEWALYQRRWID